MWDKKKALPIVYTIMNQAESDAPFKSLRQFNAFMGVLHVIQAGLMVILSNDFSLPVTATHLEFNAETFTLQPVTEELFTVRIGPAVALFLLISAVAHFTVAFPGYAKYVRDRFFSKFGG